MNDRFAEERLRLKYSNPHALAVALGVSHTSVKRVEDGKSVPGGELLAAFSRLGADIQYVLTGKRAAEIDITLFGVVEYALAQAYRNLRGDAAEPERIRGRVVALAYNKALGLLTAEADVGRVAMLMAAQTLLSLDDPSEPDLLERNLLRPIGVPAQVSELSAEQTPPTKLVVKGKGHRVAGRDYHEGSKKD